MSEASLNPYQSVPLQDQTPATGPAKRPTGLLIFCVLILALASLGFLGSVFGGVMLAVSGGKVDYKQQFGSQPNTEINPEAVPKLDQLTTAHASMYVGSTIAALVVSVLLIVGCVAAIYPWRSGGFILSFALIAAILYLLAHGVVIMKAYGDLASVIKSHPDDFLIPKGDADERAIGMMNTMFSVIYTVLPILTWVFNAIKIVFYASVLAYLRKKNVRDFISRTPV